MSLAYKLWKIGSVLSEDDIKKSIKVEPDFETGDEPNYLNIDFTFENDNISKISLNKRSIKKDNKTDKLFLSKKIGGTSNAFYLYPNILIQKDKPLKGIKNIKNTLIYSTQNYCNQKYKTYTEYIIDKLEEFCNENSIKDYPKDNYLIWLSINGKTFYELMPEIWTNFYNHPFINQKEKALFISNIKGFDIFTNEKTEIGYKTDFKVFSYDQYHDSLNYRLDENMPLSKESARNIKYAWMYILDNLVFYYKGLQYIIIPNLLTDDKEILKTVIKRFVKAKNRSSNKRTILEKLKKEEGKLKKDIEKLQKKRKDINKSEKKLNETHQEIDKIDLGMVKELLEQVETLDEYINIVTLDYLFVNIDRKNLSFELKGTIEDVIPSRMSKVVEKMREYQVEDLVKLGVKNKDKTYLQDYFNRDEMELRKNHIPLFKERSSELKEYLFTERLYLAKLLLSDIKIKHSDLLQRFEFNRNYGYDKKKRMTKDGIKEWLQYSSSFVEDEKKLIQFLQSLNIIQED